MQAPEQERKCQLIAGAIAELDLEQIAVTRRLQRMGATTAFVSGYSPAANALYRSVMGSEHELCEPRVREWST